MYKCDKIKCSEGSIIKMMYNCKFKKNTGAFVCAVYLSAAAVFFAVCDMTYNSVTGLHPALFNLRSGNYFTLDLIFVLAPVFSLLCTVFARFRPVLAAFSPALLAVWTLYFHSIDKTADFKPWTLIPCAAVMIIALLTSSGLFCSGWFAFIACALSSAAFVAAAALRVPQLFFYSSAYNGFNVYISRVLCHMLVLLSPGVLCLGLEFESKEKNTEAYNSMIDGDSPEGDALKDATALKEDDDILK